MSKHRTAYDDLLECNTAWKEFKHALYIGLGIDKLCEYLNRMINKLTNRQTNE